MREMLAIEAEIRREIRNQRANRRSPFVNPTPPLTGSRILRLVAQSSSAS